MEKDFEIVEHTADVGIKVYGKSYIELFVNAAKGLFFLIVGNIDANKKEEIWRDVAINAETIEDLLVYWLNELLSLFYTYRFLPIEYNIDIDKKEKFLLAGKVKGIEFDPYKEKVSHEIKAATYHNLEIKEDSKGYKTEIIFDV